MADPKEIYLQPICCADNDEIGRLWCQDPDPEECDEGVPWTRYVLADYVPTDAPQPRIIDDNGIAMRSMDGSAAASGYINAILALQQLRRAIQSDVEPDHFSDAVDEAEKLIKGAGLSL